MLGIIRNVGVGMGGDVEIRAEQRKGQERPREAKRAHMESAPSHKPPAVDAVKNKGEQGTLSTKKQRCFASRLLSCWTPNNIHIHSTLLIMHEMSLSKCDQNIQNQANKCSSCRAFSKRKRQTTK